MNPSEIKDTLGELQNEFAGLWKRNDALEAYLAATWDIASDLPQNLTHKEPMPSFDLKYDIARLKGKLNKPIEIHIEQHSDLKRAETKADNLEDIEANWLVRLGLSSGGWLWDAIYYGQCVKSYVPVWLEWQDYAIPAQREGEPNAEYNDRVDAYQREWFGWSLTVDPVRTSTFMEHRRRLNMACREIEIPYIEVAKRYGEYDRSESRSVEDERDLMFSICRKEFPWVRVGEGNSRDADDPSVLTKKVKVAILDNGVAISHCIEGPDGMHEVGSYDNTIGRPSLFVLSGAYNAGEPLDRRFEPLMLGLMQNYKNRDWHMSAIASYIASAAPDGLLLTPDGIREYVNMSPEERESLVYQRGTDGLRPLAGTPVSTMATADQIKLIESQLEHIGAEIQRQRPSAIFDNGATTAEVIERGTAAAILHESKQEEMGTQSAVNDDTRLVDEVLGSLEHFAAHAINPHYQKGSKAKSDADNPLYAVMTGQERVKGREIKRGAQITLLPSDVDFPHTRQVEAVNVSLSSQAARRAEADARWFRPDGVRTITFDQLLEEHGITNVSQHKIDLTADQLYQIEVPKALQQVSDTATQFVAAFLGAPPEATQPADVSVEQAPGVQGGGNGIQRQGAPAVEGVQGISQSVG